MWRKTEIPIMSKFNVPKPAAPKFQNAAGGISFVLDSKIDLVIRLLSWFCNDGAYVSKEQQQQEIRALIQAIPDKQFVAKAAIFARTQWGMRSVSHLVTGELFRAGISKEPWARSFVDAVVERVDDMTEILAYWMSIAFIKNAKGRTKIPNAMLRGFRDAFGRFDTYQLGKYQAKSRSVSLVDLMRLVHPVPSPRNEEGLRKLVQGTLEADGTRQAAMVKATQDIQDPNEKQTAKNAVWHQMLPTMGVFELLKNLTHLIDEAPELVDDACKKLMDLAAIKRSRIFPFRYYTALSMVAHHAEVSGASRALYPPVMQALGNALSIACENVPELQNSLVVLDVSGSMQTPLTAYAAAMARARRGRSAMNPISVKEAGALMASVLAARSWAELMVFASDAKMALYVSNENPLTLARQLATVDGYNGHGTNFEAIFNRASRSYDRIVIFSDMFGCMCGMAEGYKGASAWIHGGECTTAFAQYKQRTGADPYVYFVNLAGSGGSMLNPRNPKVVQLAGFSEKLFDLISMWEQDPNVLVHEVEKIKL